MSFKPTFETLPRVVAILEGFEFGNSNFELELSIVNTSLTGCSLNITVGPNTGLAYIEVRIVATDERN